MVAVQDVQSNVCIVPRGKHHVPMIFRAVCSSGVKHWTAGKVLEILIQEALITPAHPKLGLAT